MDSNQPAESNEVEENYEVGSYQPTVVPIEIEKRLDFIDIAEDGYTILGSSNLSGRYWRGSVWYFKNAKYAPNVSLTGIECNSSVCDGKFLNDKKTIFVGEDSGAVCLYKLVEDNEQITFERKHSCNDHDSSVLSISVFPNNKGAVTASMDMCIKVWDIEDLIPTHSFPQAHSHHVTGVSCLEPNVFASSGLDGAALVWDARKDKPASVIVDDPKERLTAVTWQSCDGGNTLIVGSEFGSIAVYDVRACSKLHQSNPFNRPVYRLLSIKSSTLAACADSNEVKLLDPSKSLEVSYVDGRHKDFVRGLSYDPTTSLVISCGWDQKVYPHPLEPQWKIV